MAGEVRSNASKRARVTFLRPLAARKYPAFLFRNRGCLHSRLGNDRDNKSKSKIHMVGSSSTLGMLVVNFGTLCHRTRMILYADDGLASLSKAQIGRCDFWASLKNSNPAPSSS